MTDPLALVLYDKLMPGSALVNRLQDLKYRVQTINSPAVLLKTAQEAKPLVVLADIESNSASVCDAIAKLKATKATSHLPVIGFGHDPGAGLQDQARKAGANVIANEAAILGHLPQLLDQALQIE